MAVAPLPDETPILRWCLPAGSISDARLGIHWSFPPVLILFPAFQGAEHGAWWGFVVAVSVPLLFCLVLFREFGRLTAARSLGIPASRIEVWPLGGLDPVGLEAEGVTELRLGLAGPVLHGLMIGFFVAAFSITGVAIGDDFLDPTHWWPVSTIHGTADFGEHVLYLVHKLNLLVLLFNLIPAWPLDGGRVVRGLLRLPLGADHSRRATALIALVSTAAMFGYAFYLGRYLVAAIAVGVFLVTRGHRRRVPAP